MKHPDKETLSQLMDGEWQDIDSQARIADLCSDDELKATWARYHLIRDVMKNESVNLDTDIASRVRASLEDEPAHTNVTHIGGERSPAVQTDEPSTEQEAPAASRRASYGGLAVAASVALATVVGLNYLGNNGTQNSAPQTVAAVSVPSNTTVIPGQVLPQVELVANRGSYWVDGEKDRDAAREARLNMMLSQHIENSPTATYQGMLPYSRLVGYDEATIEQ